MTNRISLYVTSEHSRPLLLPWLQFVLIQQVGHYFNYLPLYSLPKNLQERLKLLFYQICHQIPFQYLYIELCDHQYPYDQMQLNDH